MDKYAMQRASKEGDVIKVWQLLERGVSVDSQDDKGRTPLHRAAEESFHAVAELLISRKCNLNLKDRRGRTPVLVAAEWGHKSFVDLLLPGSQVNCADDNMYTLLHYASENGWTDIVHSILDREEANLNAGMGRWDTPPLMLAVKEKHDDIAELLIRAGADVNRRDAMKETALHLATFFGRTQMVKVLLGKERLDLNPQNEDGETPLHLACRYGRREVVMQLLVAGADTTIKNNEGNTALSEHIKKGTFTLEDIRLFVQHGAFLQHCDYVRICQNPFLDEVLEDVGICTQSIVNKFHYQSLPALSSISYFARKLPRVDKFKLNARQVDEVENLVRCEIERNTFCNVDEAHPVALSALCVLSLITCQSGTKRSASPDLGDGNSPFKNFPYNRNLS